MKKAGSGNLKIWTRPGKKSSRAKPSKKLTDKSLSEQQFREKIIEDIRPWGKYRSYPRTLARSIKIITVKPGASLSLQYHLHRSEFWIILDSGLEITLGQKIWQPAPGDEIFIPPKTPHRLRGLGPKPCRVMEIWIGRSSEDDIIRLDDQYGRT